MSRTTLQRYRSGEDEPGVENLAKLVEAIRHITGKAIRASDLYDLGESEPLGPRSSLCSTAYMPFTGKRFDTRFDRYLRRHGIHPICLAAAVPVARQTIYKKRRGRETFMVNLLARVVIALRRLGYDAKASDIAYVGESARINSATAQSASSNGRRRAEHE